MASLTLNAGGYRYGFNGKETDDEIKGTGNSVDFGARIHDPRLGRFLSVDPLAKQFPSESNYSYAGNNPILFIDKDGEKKYLYFIILTDYGVARCTLVNDKIIKLKVSHSKHSGIDGYGTDKTWIVNDIHQIVLIDTRKGGLFIGLGNEKYTNSESNIINALDIVLTGNGGEQNGGWYLVSKELGFDPTKMKSKNYAPEILVDDLLSLIKGASKFKEKRAISKEWKDSNWKKIEKIVKGIKGIFKSVEVADKKYEKNKELVDGTIEKMLNLGSNIKSSKTHKDSCVVCNKT